MDFTAYYKLELETLRHLNGRRLILYFAALSFKAGKDNITTATPGLFACRKVSFQHPFYGGQQVKVLASVGHTEKSKNPRNGAAVWV